MRCIIYARKSTEEDDRQVLSIEAQLVELKEFAAMTDIRQNFSHPNSAKEKLEIVIRAAPPPFRFFAGGLPRRRRRRKRLGLIQGFCTNIKLSDFCPTDSAARSAWWLETKSYALRKPRHRLASLGNPKKKKCLLLFCFARGWIFLKWKGHFSLVSAEALRGGGGADSFVQFPLEKGSRKVYNYSTRSKN